MVIVVVNPWTGKSGDFVSEIIGYNREMLWARGLMDDREAGIRGIESS